MLFFMVLLFVVTVPIAGLLFFRVYVCMPLALELDWHIRNPQTFVSTYLLTRSFDVSGKSKEKILFVSL